MLNAKLFGALALILLLVAFLTSDHVLYLLKPTTIVSFFSAMSAARHQQGTLVMVIGLYARLWLALICGALALAYFVVARWARRAPNRVIGLIGFVAVAVGIVVRFSWDFLMRHAPPVDSNIPLFLLYAAVYNALYWGTLFCVASLIWTTTREGVTRIRARLVGQNAG